MTSFTDAEIVWTIPRLSRRAIRHYSMIRVDRGPEWNKRMRQIHDEAMRKRDERRALCAEPVLGEA